MALSCNVHHVRSLVSSFLVYCMPSFPFVALLDSQEGFDPEMHQRRQTGVVLYVKGHSCGVGETSSVVQHMHCPALRQ
jgi:hypothetical protein